MLALSVAEEASAGINGLSLLATTLFYDGWSIPWYRFMLPLGYYTPLRYMYAYKEREPFGLKNQQMPAGWRDAKMQPQDIGYINAHGTATQAGDIEETRAIKQAFGDHAHRVPVSSTKSMHGHLMGATGVVEFMAAVLALQHNAIPPTINLRQPDPECDLDYVPNVGRRDVELNAVMFNSFAFGGSNVVLVAKRFEK